MRVTLPKSGDDDLSALMHRLVCGVHSVHRSGCSGTNEPVPAERCGSVRLESCFCALRRAL